MPTPEHVEALAHIIDARDCAPLCSCVMPGWHRCDCADCDARAILVAIAKPGPALDAVLAALVEGGRLVEDRRPLPDGYAGQSIATDGKRAVICKPSTVQRRLVEAEWRTSQDGPQDARGEG